MLVLLVLGQTLLATDYLANVLPYHGGNLLEAAILVVFALLFAWIGVGFWLSLYGFWVRRRGGDRQSLMARHSAEQLAATPLAKTAIVMPIYHEPVNRSLNGLRALYRSLQRSGQLDRFDFYILSDSRDPEVWLEEQAAWYRLCGELDAHGRLFYRRRQLNLNYKSGNVADFLRRWGRRYRYLLVLDADSLLDGTTVVRMVQLMQRESQVGILQTAPTLINAHSLFARVQQFAGRVYGPLFARGLAAVQLGEAAFWGHNALIRVQPFMRYCGLRNLRGPGLFSGPVLSHDFVEAACLGRAGLEIWLEPALGDSYEESPPTLDDDLARDRRWTKGNLQHLWLLLSMPKLRLAHRLVFINGIMSYLASPLWLAFLALTTIEAARLTLWPIDYFPQQHSLFPRWPEWHPGQAAALAGSTLVLLFLPKFAALLDVLLTRRQADYGGTLRLSGSVVGEILVSALLAPVRMLAHSRFVLEALFNLRLSWSGQNRTAEARWRDVLLQHLPGTLIAAGWATFALWLDPMFFYWSLPVAIPLLLAAPTSMVLGKLAGGRLATRAGLFQTRDTSAAADLLAGLEEPPPGQRRFSALERAVIDPQHNALHRHLSRSRGTLQQRRLAARFERVAAQGPAALPVTERAALMGDRESLRKLHDLAWKAAPDSWWGERVLAYQRNLTRTDADQG